MFKRLIHPLILLSAIATIPLGERLLPPKWAVARQLELYEFEQVTRFKDFLKFFCSDQKSGKYSCLSISWDYGILLTIDIDGSDYFLANYDLKTKSDRLRLSYYTGNKEIWTSYDGRKDLVRQTKEGHIQWKNKDGEMVTYKRFKGDRLPASFK